MLRHKKHIVLIALLIAAWSITFFLSSDTYKHYIYRSDAQKVEQTVGTLLSYYKNIKTARLSDLKQAHKIHPGLHLFLYRNKQPVFWTSNNIPLDENIPLQPFAPKLMRLKNGWYILAQKPLEHDVLLAVILVKNIYPYENPHLKNEFPDIYRLRQWYDLTLDKPGTEIAFPVQISPSQTVYLIPDKNNFKYSSYAVFAGIAAVMLTFLFVHLIFSVYLPQNILYAAFEVLLIFLLRFLFQFMQIPQLLYHHELFSPKYFAVSDWLPSLGDLMITVLTTLLVVKIALDHWKKYPSQTVSTITGTLVLAVKQVLSVAAVVLIYHLIYNSTLHFNLNDIYEFSWHSIFALSCVLILLGLYFVILSEWYKRPVSRQWFVAGITLHILFYILVNQYIKNSIYFFSVLILFEVILFFYRREKTHLAAYFPLITIMLFAFGLSITIVNMSEAEEHDERRFLSEKMINDKDPIAEYLFIDIEKKIKSDTKLAAQLKHYWEHKEQVDEYLQKKYFNGYWSKYDISFVECQAGDTILIEGENQEVLCESFFKSRIEKSPDFYMSPPAPIYFVNDDNGVIYIADIVIPDENNLSHHIYIEFYYKFFPKTEGYPELLLSDKQLKQIVKMGNYSFAKYKNGILINKLGEFDYYTRLDTSYITNRNNRFFTEDGYNHYLYHNNQNTVLLSLPQVSMIEKMSVFSYVFILIGLVFIFGYFIFQTPFSWQSLTLQSFNTKIQFFVITNIFIAFTLIAIGTVYYIRYQYTEKNITNITEKIQSVMVEVEHKLGDADTLTFAQKEMMSYYLVKFSNVFYTDINLYNTRGRLFATSRPEVFRNGLLNRLMPYNVYEALTLKHKSEFIHQEQIGNLSYLSAYVPFRNYKNRVLAYLNLPYFAKQHALEEELANFYVALINIYVLVFVLSVILAVIFAGYLSAPLRLIKSTISKLQIGKTNELIEWQTNDEIGELIKEYNKKVIELEKSARLLAKSERESAWREMAKQVAHEIKNPLTPMKLSIQHLQRMTAGIDQEIKQKIDKTAQILIEQIDTLATIATEFSNFAKLPEPQLEKVDVLKIARDCSLLFDEQKAKITFVNNTGVSTVFIRADKDQMIRIFNNLIKNAIQSVRPDKLPKIEISVGIQSQEVIVAVKDNGEGITAEKQAKIFEPNFTTKTGGMGLGLAMVKNFVETFNGKIWFTSAEGKGTTFYVSFPQSGD